MRLDLGSLEACRSRRISKNSSSRRITRLVRVFMLGTHRDELQMFAQVCLDGYCVFSVETAIFLLSLSSNELKENARNTKPYQ